MKIGELNEAVQLLQRDLRLYGPRLARAVPDFALRISPVLQAYSKPFLVRKLKTDAAFQVRRHRQLTFNAGGFAKFHAPIGAAERAGLIPPDIAKIARRMAVEQLVMHELVHVSVGLIHFADVQTLKGLVGVHALGELDLIADVTAARICARLEMLRAQERGPTLYATRLLQQLYVMGSFAFPAFGAPPDKPHKQQRFLGLAMTTARVDDFLASPDAFKAMAGELPLDAPVYPYLDRVDGTMLVTAFTPDRVLWGGTVRVDPGLLAVTCNELSDVPFEVSVDRAGLLLRQIGRLKSGAAPDTGQSANLGRAAG